MRKLRAASVERIAAVKGIGPGSAADIAEFLEALDEESTHSVPGAGDAHRSGS